MSAIAQLDKDTLCQIYLQFLYRDMRFDNKQNESDIAKTYGEILYPSVEKLLAAITLTPDDVFIDLGSGLGKLVLQVFLKSCVREACGIEIVPELHEQAVRAAQKLQSDLPDFYAGGRKLTFLSGDFLQFPLTSATVLFLCSPCFSPETLLALGEIINDTPSIGTVLTLRPIKNLHRLVFKKIIHIECSWDSGLCYVYERSA